MSISANSYEHIGKGLTEKMLATYGPLMDAKSLCKVLSYPSVAALLAAKARGRIPFQLESLEGRRGYFGLTEQVAAYVAASFSKQSRESVESDPSARKNQ
jgi:hypothetical protein